jgi:Putative metal-binding motif
MYTRILPVLAIVMTLSGIGCDEQRELMPQDIHVAEEFIDFGVVPSGSSVTFTTRVHNAGDAPLEFSIDPVLEEESTNLAFTLTDTFSEIPARSYRELEITYAPIAEEDAYGYIRLWTNDPDEANRGIVLTGSSFPGYPQAYVTPGLVEFGFVAEGNTAESTVEIWNVGEVPIDVASVAVGGSESLFEVVNAPEYPIPPGEKALVTVSFTSEGGNQEIAALTVEITDVINSFTVNLSANSPGSTNNGPPQINILDPTEPKVFYLYQDLYIQARAFDAQQPNIGLYCTLESFQHGVAIGDQLGLIEQNTSDPVTSILEFNIEIDDSDFADAPGLHTLTICCTDVFNTTACETLVVSIDTGISTMDDDGDGYAEDDGDCADGDATVYPGAIELADNIDNDCDSVVDEDTDFSDDDGDGYCEGPTCSDGSQPGDCHDDDPLINPGALETANFYDDNCDGTIDEGTVYYDDDGDGFSEALGDCNDEDPEIYRDATEWCDLKDNDCDSEVDEGCIDDTPPLILVGGLNADRVAVKIGEPVQLNLTVISGPDAVLDYDWQCSGGEFSEINENEATWMAPDEADAYQVFCNVIDGASGQDKWAFLEITVLKTDPVQSINRRDNDCSIAASGTGTPTAAVAVLAILALRLIYRRRR